MSIEMDELTFDVRDEFQRRPVADKVTRLLKSEADVSPMIIDGGWGTGKSEFCYKLVSLIKESEPEFQAVYVDAFKADHADEPLMTLLAAILKLLPEKEKSSLMQKALPAVRFGVKTAMKAGVSWILKQEAVDVADALDKDLKKAGDDAINYAVETLLEDHVASEESIKTLRTALEEIAANKSIVVFVDELDRCRPNYALAMLESVKHVFDVSGVQFVLVTNTSHLRASINHCYGITEQEAQRYLDKFVKFSFTLPQFYKPNSHTTINNSVEHTKSLINSSKLLNGSGINKNGVVDFACNLVKVNRLSLREVETYIRHLEFYHALVGAEEKLPENIIHGYALLRVLGVFLFCFKPIHADEMLNGMLDIKLIAGLMGKIGLHDRETGYADIEDIVVALLLRESNYEDLNFGTIDEKDSKYWDEAIRSLFQGSFFRSESEGKVKVITEVIESLRLMG